MAACASLFQTAVVGQSVFLSGAQRGLKDVSRGEARVVCKKQGIHPPFFPEAKVYCNGALVMTTGGTQEEYIVDVWSGNHPYFQGSKATLVADKGRVDKFRERYGEASSLSVIPTLTTGEIVWTRKKKDNKKGKGRR
eukprot:jgi/Mesen1/3746/ME000204S03003